jgi:hypothetical protein
VKQHTLPLRSIVAFVSLNLKPQHHSTQSHGIHRFVLLAVQRLIKSEERASITSFTLIKLDKPRTREMNGNVKVERSEVCN